MLWLLSLVWASWQEYDFTSLLADWWKSFCVFLQSMNRNFLFIWRDLSFLWFINLQFEFLLKSTIYLKLFKIVSKENRTDRSLGLINMYSEYYKTLCNAYFKYHCETETRNKRFSLKFYFYWPWLDIWEREWNYCLVSSTPRQIFEPKVKYFQENVSFDLTFLFFFLRFLLIKTVKNASECCHNLSVFS